jgi:hypothetical protein
MRFRVLSGEALVRRTKPSLDVVYESGGLRVEADADAVVATSGRGERVIAIGIFAGRRVGDRLEPIESSASFVASLAGESDAARWSASYDGDAVILRVADDQATIAGDRFFKRDVYTQEAPGGVALATDLSLLPDNPARDGYDSAALAHMLTYYGHRPPKRHTMYRAVRRLGIGDVATVRNGSLDVTTAPFEPAPTREYGEADHQRYYEAFLDYIAGAGSPDGNTLFLSSGWDSSSVLAALVHVFGRDKVTGVIGRMLYSARSGNCNKFEIERAQGIARHYGVKLHMVDLDFVNSGPDWVERVRDTFKAHNIQSQTGLNHARLAHGAAEVSPGMPMFAGEISDGAHNLGFSQYVTIFHPTQGFREYSDKMASYLFGPTFIREYLAGRHEQDAVFQLFRDRAAAAGTMFDTPATGRDAQLRQMLISFFLRNGRMPFWSGQNSRMLTRKGLSAYTDEMSNAYFSGVEQAEPEQMYSWYLQLYNSFHWQGSTVSTVQKMGDLFGTKAHNPYWAASIQDFLHAMPESWGRGLDLTHTKYPLKRMLREKLGFPMDLHVGPHSYTYDVDPTFNHSFELMYHSTIGTLAREILASKPYHQVMSPEWFDMAYVDGIVDGYLKGTEHRGAALNDLVSVWLLCQTGWFA